MTTFWFSRRALGDVERFIDFLLETDPASAEATFEVINDAVQVLARHPYIGRPARGRLRELIISRGSTGYVALYSFDPKADAITIHALRHQREDGSA